MIEIYLASLLFGIGSMYSQAQTKKLSSNNNSSNSNNSSSSNSNSNSSNSNNPYKQNNLSEVENAENKIAKKLDKKCKTILPRSFSHILDEETEELLNNNTEVLKYKPKNNNAIKSSLTGTDISIDQFITSKTIDKENSNEFTTNTWAIPYFKGTATQNMNTNGYKNKLDIHTGKSEFNFHKKETKNFFKPNKDISFVNGTPHYLNKIEDRFIKSTNRNTELPFEQIKVARGVGQSYGDSGKGGFHQFEINDLVRPKNVDELRVLSNPKKTYSEPIQSGKHIDKRASSAAVGKYRPDTFYLNNKSRWNKTNGAYLKGKSSEKFINKPTNRTISKQIVGHAGPASKKNPSKRGNYKKSTNNNYKYDSPANPANAGSWNIKKTGNKENFQSVVKVDDNYDISSYGKDGMKLPPNERDTTQNKTVITNLVEAVKAVIAPLQDKMKRTKKQNIEGNPNIKGYMNSSIPSKVTVYDPNDIAKTTIKETTEINEHDGHINGPKKITVYDPNDIARTTIKETTENNSMETQIKGATKLTVYDPNDIAKTTIKETLIHDTRTGNIQVERNKKQMDYKFASAKKTMKETTIDNVHHSNLSYVKGDGKGYLSTKYFAPSTLKQLTSDKEYGGNISSAINDKGGYLSNKFYAPATQKQSTSDNDYTGTANSSNKNLMDYTSMLNAETNPNKEIIAQGRAPTQNNVKIAGGSKSQGDVGFSKQNALIDSSSYSKISPQNGGAISSNDLGNEVTNPRVSLSNENLQDKINPNILSQLDNNQYHLSINRQPNEGFEGGNEEENNTDTDSYFDDIML